MRCIGLIGHKNSRPIEQGMKRMKWMEFIKLQASDISGDPMQRITVLPREITATPGLLSAEVYTHAAVTGDIALLLVWETEQPQYQGSLIGFQLAEELKKFGLIAHAVWICKK
jgi:hypothetical protein